MAKKQQNCVLLYWAPTRITWPWSIEGVDGVDGREEEPLLAASRNVTLAIWGLPINDPVIRKWLNESQVGVRMTSPINFSTVTIGEFFEEEVSSVGDELSSNANSKSSFLASKWPTMQVIPEYKRILFTSGT